MRNNELHRAFCFDPHCNRCTRAKMEQRRRPKLGPRMERRIDVTNCECGGLADLTHWSRGAAGGEDLHVLIQCLKCGCGVHREMMTDGRDFEAMRDEVDRLNSIPVKFKEKIPAENRAGAWVVGMPVVIGGCDET